MWLVGPDPLDIYVGQEKGSVAVFGQSPNWTSYADIKSGIDMLFKTAAENPKPLWRRQTPVRIWLSGAIARPFLLGPISGLKSWAEVKSFAQAAATDAVGLDEPCAVEVEAWPEAYPALVTAMSAEVLSWIESKAVEHRLQLKSVRPWWAAAFNEVTTKHDRSRLVSVNDRDSMTLLGGRSGRLETASCYTPKTSSEQADKLLSRLALVAGATADETLRISLAGPTDIATIDVPFGAIEGIA